MRMAMLSIVAVCMAMPGTASAQLALARPVVQAPDTGTLMPGRYQIETLDGRCLGFGADSESRPMFVPLPCGRSSVVTVAPAVGGYVRLQFSQARLCVTIDFQVADAVAMIAPCQSEAPGTGAGSAMQVFEPRYDASLQRFQFQQPNVYASSTAADDHECLTSDGRLQVVLSKCSDRTPFTRFRLTPVQDPAYVAPAGSVPAPYAQPSGTPVVVAEPARRTIVPFIAALPIFARPALDGVFRMKLNGADQCVAVGLAEQNGDAPLRATPDCATGTQFHFRPRGDRFTIEIEGTGLCLRHARAVQEETPAVAAPCGSDQSFWFAVAPVNGSLWQIENGSCLTSEWPGTDRIGFRGCDGAAVQRFELRPR